MWEIVYEFLKAHIEITIFGAITLIQVAPIKINPWSWVAKSIHGILLGDIDRKLDSIAHKVDRLEEQAQEDKALQARKHILRFADELYNGEKHSKEYFDDVLTDDIDGYEKYCESHPNFRNNKTVMSIQLVKDTYAKLMEEHKFL